MWTKRHKTDTSWQTTSSDVKMVRKSASTAMGQICRQQSLREANVCVLSECCKEKPTRPDIKMRRISLQTLMSKRTRTWRFLLLCSVFLLGYLAMFYSSFSEDVAGWEEPTSMDVHDRGLGRRLLHDSSSSNSNYPPDLFTLEMLRRGAVVLHVIGMIYMFIALAVVCDEFFVPSLTVITERLEIPEDVAGATFMAAGGSAPELFTSIIGVFIAKNNVGIGTIVGSAVFNILFVIGMCALLSSRVLDLTWWPLFRDISFYSTSLVLLIVFFYDGLIYWWEALILFLFYFGYVFFMKYDSVVEASVKGFLCRYGRKSQVQKTDQVPRARQEGRPSLPIIHAGSGRYRHSIVQLMIYTIDPLSQGKVHETAAQLQAIANLPERDNLVDKDNSVNVQVVSNSHVSDSHTSVATCSNTIGSDVNNIIGSDVNNCISPNAYLEKQNEHKVTEDASSPPPAPDDCASSPDKCKEDHTWEDEPLDLSWPKTWQEQISYLLLAPIFFPLWITLADVRWPEKRKWFALTFMGSVVWIAAFSYLMVWWANQTGETIGIPDEVMGLTILAAGTSIPDLITSVIVAKKGFSDMAVSSSVGSNIFDITVGLPFPWLLFGAVFRGAPYEVNSRGLLCSIILLFLMLVAVIVVIAACRWRMNKLMGALMLILYVLFVVVSVLLEYQSIKCPA